MSPFLKRTLSTAVLVPALLLGTTGPAVAATNTLTITAINRSGAKVSLWTKVVNLASSQSYNVRTNTKRTLPKGNYAVLALITTGATNTLGGRTVKVSGASKLTIDARYGKRVNLALSPAVTRLGQDLQAQICSNTGGADVEIDAWGGNGSALYVIPTASKKISFAAMATWSDPDGVADNYAVLHRTIGVPSNPSRTFYQSRLGTTTVETRRGPTGTQYSAMAVQPTHTGCGSYLYAGLWNLSQPNTAKIHFSPGPWDIRSSYPTYASNGEYHSLGEQTARRTAVAGRSSFVRFGGASWGPGFHLPMTYQGRIIFPLDDMFQDPNFNGLNGNHNYIAGDRAKATLTFGGKVVKTAYDTGFGQYMPDLEYRVKKAGWYTLTNTASRYYQGVSFQSGMLSTGSTVTHRFYSKPNTSVLSQTMSIQHMPTGLNSYNRAKPGSVTNVALKLNRYTLWGDIKRSANPTLKSLSTKVSFDGGKTWKSVPVKKINGVWAAVVTNPATGAVSIRTRATYTNGGYTEAGIQRAYAIG
ncbi:hypothetical protein [Actinoplanes sp. NPDC026670]|uniref:hypothetical protein n=1 Tax=Actinoplanes sp. NPDC026670 TaxID=3154700 RepID=UPI0033D5F154